MVTLPCLSLAIIILAGIEGDAAMVAGKTFILKDCRRIRLRLAIKKEASRKNMMSISGMISIRAFLCGNGEPIFICNGSATAGAGSVLTFFANTDSKKMQD